MGLRCYYEPRPISGEDRRGGERFRVRSVGGDVREGLAGESGDEYVGKIGGFSHESELDLAILVNDFLENGSGGSDSRRWSSDSDSGIPDLGHLAKMIALHKRPADQFETDLLAVVQSLLLSINDLNLCGPSVGQCNSSCIRGSLVKLLRSSGYEASICISKWQGSDKVPGGDHEYVVVIHKGECLIVDIDFRSHFEIARAVESYEAILESLPVVYVGTWNRLKPLLQVMADAARSSLNQNSMPLPPWRSLAYLQAKWGHSIYEQTCMKDEREMHTTRFAMHKQCAGHLMRLKSALQFEIESERLMKPIKIHKKWRVKPERLETTFLKA